uniref:O-acyltransferase n=1 Tax=Chlamydomonas euryale TaxID=1486919 RepID=A0A7R9VM43_9CHLO
MASSELRSAPGTAGADTGAAAAQRAPGSPPPSHARQMRPDMLASTPVHVSVKFSYLSSERMWHEKHSGLYNLAAVILVAGNIRMALENALKYGLRSGGRMVSFLTFGNPNIPLALCYPIMLLMVLLSLVSELAAYRFLLIERSIYTQLTKQRDLSSADAVASLARRASVAEWLVFLSNIANTTAAIGVPWAVIYNTKAEPAEAIVLILLACILWMKLVSYHHVCWDLRRCRRAAGYAFVEATGAETAGSRRIRTATSGESRAPSRSASGDAVSAASCSLDDRSPSDDATGRTPSGGEGGEGDDAASAYAGLCGYERGTPSTPAEWALLRYPENLTLSNLAYFAAAPTLTYQVNYPRTEKIRLKWLGRRVFELAIVLTAMVLLVNQYIFPAVHNSMRPLQEMDWLHLCERVLRLALPNTYVWLCMFYSLFHLWLNILAELLRFGDREFYKDWWNASTVGEYWRLWNMPVHKWLLRHVYFPSIRLGCSKMVSMVLVFVVSAFFHELLLGVPLHMVRFWAFTGIMLQVPLIIISEKIKRRLNSDQWGNIMFWLSFCIVGQPVCTLIYYHDYMKINGGL